MSNIFIAGASGFVGSNLYKRLCNSNVKGSCFSKEKNGLVKCDFRDYGQTLNAISGSDIVFMCAAQTYGADIMHSDPECLIFDNININSNILRACKELSVSKVVFISSSTVYQESFRPLTEEDYDMNKQPYSLYQGVGWMKRYIEQLCRFYHDTYGMNISIVRPTAIYGPGDKIGKGAHVIPALIERTISLDEIDCLEVWGKGYAVKDYIYIDDFISMLLNVARGYDSIEPINISTSVGTHIYDVVKHILGYSKKDVIVKYMKDKPEAIPYRVLSNEKYKALFGEPCFISIEKGLERTYAWIKSYLQQ